MPKLAISYRRDDSAGITGRIYEKLTEAFGAQNTFVDVDGIPFGVDFRDHIQGVLQRVDCLLVVIGPRWLGVTDESRRIDDPSDPVRVEVASALRQSLPILPVLVDGAKMPTASELPDEISNISYLNAIRIDSGRDFKQHSTWLIETLRLRDQSTARPVLWPILVPASISAAACFSLLFFI